MTPRETYRPFCGPARLGHTTCNHNYSDVSIIINYILNNSVCPGEEFLFSKGEGALHHNLRGRDMIIVNFNTVCHIKMNIQN